MSCCNFGREDEEYLHSEAQRRFFEGLSRRFCHLGFQPKTAKAEYLERLNRLARVLMGSEEELYPLKAASLLERSSSPLSKEVVYVLDLLVSLLEKLLLYRLNGPEGREPLEVELNAVMELFGYPFKSAELHSKLELALNGLLTALYNFTEEGDD